MREKARAAIALKFPNRVPRPAIPAEETAAYQFRAKRAAAFARGCLNCQGPISGRRSKYCSDSCNFDAVAKARLAPQVERLCAECGIKFKGYASQRKFCTKACGKKHSDRIRSRNRRDKLRTGEKVNPVEVFMRDGWKCQLCGCKTPRKLMGKQDPRAPTLDHIIPLSKGGEHTYRNTQCACYHCNCVVKRANAGGQLRLFG